MDLYKLKLIFKAYQQNFERLALSEKNMLEKFLRNCEANGLNFLPNDQAKLREINKKIINEQENFRYE